MNTSFAIGFYINSIVDPATQRANALWRVLHLPFPHSSIQIREAIHLLGHVHGILLA